jgi:hypothetical protein
MSGSDAQEIAQWAEQCRQWARNARSSEHRAALQYWERLLRQAASDPERELNDGRISNSRLPSRL